MSVNAFEVQDIKRGKPNAIKRQNISLLGLYVLLTGFWNLKGIQNWRQNCSKNKLVLENALTLAHGIGSLWVMGSCMDVYVCECERKATKVGSTETVSGTVY